MDKWFVTAVTFACCLTSGYHNTAASQAGKTLVCPRDGFIDGQTYVLKCIVDGNVVTKAQCLAIPSSVDFQLVEGSSSQLLARTAYPNCITNLTGGAWCTTKDETTQVYTYEMRLKAHRPTQTGKEMRCWMTCMKIGTSPPPPFTVNDSRCPIKFQVSDDTFDITFTCPPSLQDRKANLVVTTVDVAKLSECDLNPATGFGFRVTLKDGKYQIICEQNYPGCNTTFNTGGCRCKNIVGDIMTLELNFVFDKRTQTGGKIDLTITSCVESSTRITQKPCENLKFENPCHPNPCENLGTCIANSSSPDLFQCDCAPGFGNRTCSSRDPCHPNPCENLGTCIIDSTSPDLFQCKCAPGFVNRTCSVPEAAPVPAASNMGVIAVGLVGVILLALGAGAAMFMMRKKSMQNNASSRRMETNLLNTEASTGMPQPPAVTDQPTVMGHGRLSSASAPDASSTADESDTSVDTSEIVDDTE